MLLDLLSGLPFGVNTVALVVVAALAGAGAAEVFGQHVVVPLVGAGVGSLLYYALTVGVLLLGGRAFPVGAFALRVALPMVLLNVAAMAIVFPAVEWLSRAISRRPVDL
ncbi:MAG: hypothetical protein GX605_12565 [Chloroflexi bacterium]|nr:hypothetical protein [Chloroflexota bacterium]